MPTFRCVIDSDLDEVHDVLRPTACRCARPCTVKLQGSRRRAVDGRRRGESGGAQAPVLRQRQRSRRQRPVAVNPRRGSGLASANRRSITDRRDHLNGKQVPDEHFLSFTVDRDMASPTWRRSCCRTRTTRYSKLRRSATRRDQGRQQRRARSTSGEVVGLEPTTRAARRSRITIRAMNKLHRLLRKRKSITFTDKTDQQILLAGRRGCRAHARLEAREDDHVQARLPAQPDATSSSCGRARRAWAVTCGASTDTVHCQAAATSANELGHQAARSTQSRRRRAAPLVHAAALVGAGRQEGHGQGLEPGDQGADHR